MNTADLQPSKTYHYTPTGAEPRKLIFRYETLNYWAFDEGVTKPIILLHKQQVIKDISEI